MTMNLRPLAALALVVLIGAGCSKAPAKTGADGGSGNIVATTRDRAVKFAECMRDNGVREFPDPDASGTFTIDGVLNGSSIDSESPTWKNAIAACKDLQPSGFTGTKRTAQQQSAGLRFAQCVRDNGVKDFPDPVEGEPLIDTYRIPSSDTDEGMAALNAATKACRDAGAAAGATGP